MHCRNLAQSIPDRWLSSCPLNECGRGHDLPGQVVPLSYCSNSQEVFPDVQPESGFLSLEPIIPCPALWEDEEEILALLGVTTFQVLEGCYDNGTSCPGRSWALLPHWRPSRGSWTAICQECFELDSCNAQGLDSMALNTPSNSTIP